MPPWLHPILSTVAKIGGAITLTIMALHFSKGTDGMIGIQVFGGCVLGYLVPSLVFTYAIPVKCERCGGPAYWHDRRPISYRCTRCGFVNETDSSEG